MAHRDVGPRVTRCCLSASGRCCRPGRTQWRGHRGDTKFLVARGGYVRDACGRMVGQWGGADVEDMIPVARFLAGSGKADAARLMIRGGSAGGYTALAALTFHPDVFQAGASYYGISDLEVLARDTHKFESRYL